MKANGGVPVAITTVERFTPAQRARAGGMVAYHKRRYRGGGSEVSLRKWAEK